MRVIYIAGKFTAPTAWAIAENIRHAERWGLEVAQLGAMPLIPHANTAHFHGLKSAEFWYAGTLALLAKCDGALLIPGWHESMGARAEKEFAEARGIPVFMSNDMGELAAWLAKDTP